MKNFAKRVLFVAAVVVTSHTAQASTITFDEFAATNNNAPYIQSLFGETFTGTNSGTWGGIAHGDPGNWGIEGTNGSNFLGFNGAHGYGEVVSFATAVNSVALDVSRSNGSADGEITFQAFNGATFLGSATYSLGAINSWTHVSLNYAGTTSVAWSGTGSSFHPFGVDNLSFNVTAVPEPETYAMFLAGLGLMGAVARRRQQKSMAA